MYAMSPGGQSVYYSQDQNSSTILSDKYLRKPVTDYAGNIWWPGDVVYKHAAFHKKIFVWSERFRNLSTVSSMYRDGEILWIGTLGGGLLKYNFKTDSYHQYDQNTKGLNPLPDERVYFIAPYGGDSLVLLTRGNLVLFEKASGNSKHYPISNGPIRSAVIEENGAWVTHSGHGIFYLDFRSGQKQMFLGGKNGQPLIAQSYYIFKDRTGYLWLCTLGDGLVKFDPESKQSKSFTKETGSSNSISSNNLHMITDDQQGHLWIGTTDGLNIFDPKTEEFEVLSVKDGLSGDLIQSLVMDVEGNVWAAAGSGLSMINTTSRQIRSFNYGDGLTNQQYYPRSIHIDPEGRIYIGGSSGLNFFHPSEFGSNDIQPQVWISDIRRPIQTSYTRAIEYVDHIAMSHTEDFLTISFASTHFTDPESNIYSYRMLGIDERWIDLGKQNILTLPGLQPGEYTLEINTRTSNGSTSIRPASLRITIEPPFYKTWWFMALTFFFILALMAAISRYRIAQLKKEAQFRQKLSEIELQALRAQMNPHFIFNSLNSIKSYIAGNEPRLAAAYLTKFAQLMRHILNHSKEEQISLAEELKALQLYVELERIRYGRFTFDLTIDPLLPLEQIAIQPLVIQPFVENAIWHGLVHLDGPGKLQIRVKDQQSSISIEVEDNGIGRKAASQNGNSPEKRKSYGMQITKDRLQTKYNSQSSVEITDLYNADNKPAGTLVRMQLPKIHVS
jgi:hypothetical protein